MKKKSQQQLSRQRVARAVRGLRKTPHGGLILDEQSLDEDRYTEVKAELAKPQKERKSA